MILNRQLWERSGHWAHYKENMYFTEIDGEDYVLTGVQVCNLLANKQSFTAKTDIINGVMNKISKNGLSEDALYCIIDNTVTTLSVPSCYNWNIWVGKCFSSYNIIDGRKKLDSNP